jgi:pyridoxamine 5'-phosphate oxidase
MRILPHPPGEKMTGVTNQAPGEGARALNLAALRSSYAAGGLDEADLAADPVDQLATWLTDAIEAQVAEPNAMIVATVDADGRPSARTVLLKGLDARGAVFFTNLLSRKGRALAANPRAALVFPWHAMQRQVHVEGDVEPASREETQAYFDTRPYGSRIGAWASPQSEVVAGRSELLRRWAEATERFPEGGPVPAPEHWGGLRVRPEVVEFWQGRPDRMHDRLRYRRTSAGWTIERLAP